MYCTKCGTEYAEGAGTCASCGQPTAKPKHVRNYVVPAILVTLCCCVPLGIPAIFYAAQVDPRLAGGDIAGAEHASRKAMMWCWIAFGCGALIGAFYLAMMFLSVAQGPS